MENYKKIKTRAYLLAIGGLDPSGHAGLLADSRVFNHFGIPCKAVATAVTAQSERKFLAWQPIDLKLFKDELLAVEGKIFAVKIGMLATLAHLRILTPWLKKQRPRYLLWDPVLRSSTGMSLLKVNAIQPLLRQLIEMTDILTPNLPEAEWILERKITNLSDMETAAQQLYQMGKKPGRLIVLKGGHLPKLNSSNAMVDIVYDGKKVWRFSTQRRLVKRRGTGCTFGAAMLGEMWKGKNGVTAAQLAKKYVLAQLFDAPTL